MLSKITSSTNGPVEIELEPGKNYFWCQCGRSKTNHFVVSHVGTGISPKRNSQYLQAGKCGFACVSKLNLFFIVMAHATK